MTSKISDMLSAIESPIMDLMGSFVIGKVFVRLIRNILIFVAGWFFLWALGNYVLPQLVSTKNPTVNVILFSTSLLYFFVGVYHVVNNTKEFFKSTIEPDKLKKIHDIIDTIRGFIILVALLFFIYTIVKKGISNNWEIIVEMLYGILKIIGGGLVGIIAFLIIKISTLHSNNTQKLFLGMYILGSYFSIILSFITYGLTYEITLHGAFSWLYILFLFNAGAI